jgi:hypothetical protein
MAAGKPESGTKHYAITHAYYHLMFEVVEMLGPQRARVKNVRFVYSSQLNWTDFFAKGCTRANTVMHDWPAGEVSWIDIFDWEHEIP